MPEVSGYRVVLYGSSADAPTLKAKVELYADKGEEQQISMGKIRFHADGVTLPTDEPGKKNKPEMNLPATLLGTVIDLLRTEVPIYYAYHEGRAVLGSGIEPIGSQDEGTAKAVRVVNWPDETTPK